MRIVNERYIIESINTMFNSIVAYNAYDKKKNKKVVVSFIENEDLLKFSSEYITSNFHVLKSLNMKNITNIKSAKAVINIDGNKLEIPSYMYVTEYYGERIDTDKYVKTATFNDVANLLLKLAITINTLNYKGYYFNEIKKDDIVIYKNIKGDIDVKLKSVIAFEIEKISLRNFINADSMLFPQGIEREGTTHEDYGNSREIKILFKSIFKKFNFNNEISNELEELLSLLESSDLQSKKEVETIIEVLGKVLNKKNVERYDLQALSKIETSLDIIGRQNEISKVSKIFSEMMDRRTYGQAIVFFGDVGSGKTKLLSSIEEGISNKFLAPIITFKDSREFRIDELREILNNILIATDKQRSEEYGQYINKFLEYIIDKDFTVNRNEKLRIINRVTKLIIEYSLNCPIVLIVDDLRKKDSFFYEFIKYLVSRKDNMKNILLIMSSMTPLNNLNNNIESYKVDYLDEYECKVIVRRVLNTSNDLSHLCEEIYKETLGNPSFIIEVLKEYYNQGILRFNSKKDKWETALRVDNITIPKTIENYIKEEIDYIECDEVEILNKLSIYQNALLEEIIINNIIVNKEYLEAYDRLKIKGILIEKIGDFGILIDFSNLLTKKYIYMKIPIEERVILHSEASKIIERLSSEYLDKYLDELLLHLEYSKQIKKFIFYSQRCANICEVVANYVDAKKYYKRALKYSETEEGAKICLKIGMLHNNKGEKEKALKYYGLAYDKAKEVNNTDIIIYSNLSMGIIIGRNGDIKTLKNAIKTTHDMLENVNFKKGKLLYYYALSVYYFQTKRSSKALEYIKKAKDFSFGEYNEIDANIALIEGCIYFIKRELKKSEKCFRFAARFFDKDKYIDKYLTAQLNLGAIAEEVYQDSESAISIYNKIINIARKNKIHYVKFMVAINLSEIYIYSRKFKEAEELLLAILRDSREIDDGSSIVHATFLLSDLYIRVGNISEAAKYINITMDYKNKNNIQFDIYNQFNGFLMMYNLQLYKYDDVEGFSKIIDDESKIISTLINKSTYYLMELYKVKSKEEVEIVIQNILDCVKYIKKKDYKIDILLSTVEVLYEIGYKDFASSLFKKYKDIPKEENVQLKMAYIELLINKYATDSIITRVLRSSTKVNNPLLLSKVYYLVGCKYEESGCNVQAFKFYYESMIILKKIIFSINNEDVINFANRGLYLKVVNACINIVNNKFNLDFNISEIVKFNNIEELYDVNKVLELNHLIETTNILNVLYKYYDSMYFNNINSIEGVISKFTADIEKNIEILVRYIARVALADKVSLTYELKKSKTEVMYSYGFKNKDEVLNLSELKFNGESAILSSEELQSKSYGINNYGIAKSIMYNKFTNRNLNEKNTEDISSKIILIANSSLNNFNEVAMEKLKEIEPLLIFLLNQYNLTVNSTLDKLTGVLNRKNLEDKIENQIEYSKENKKKFALLLFDIDNFKGINDKYGHQVGDEVLKKLVYIVQSQLSSSCILGRYGGEEFIILVEYANEDELIKKANRIREKVQLNEILGSRRDVTISIGVSLYPSHSLRSEELISKADQALYKAKSLGKNCVYSWDKTLNNKSSFNNKLTGIMTGDSQKDHDGIVAIMDILDITRSSEEKQSKIKKTLSVIKSMIKSEGIQLIYADEINKLDWDSIIINKKLVLDVIENKKGLYTVDWDNLMEDKRKYEVDWKSVCITPIIYNGKVLAVLYGWVSVNDREFKFRELNLMNMLGELLLPII